MSNSLVRKSLALFGYESNLKEERKKRRRDKSRGALDLIPINHRIITKKNKRGATNIVRSSKKTVEEAKKYIDSKIDPTEENVKRLLLLSGNGTDTILLSDKLLNRANDKTYHSIEKKLEISQETIFTEEDFENFDKEYSEL